MDDLFTICFDPFFAGKFQFYDRVFHVEPSQLLKRVDELNKNSLFVKYRVYRVTFQDIEAPTK